MIGILTALILSVTGIGLIFKIGRKPLAHQYLFPTGMALLLIHTLMDAIPFIKGGNHYYLSPTWQISLILRYASAVLFLQFLRKQHNSHLRPGEFLLWVLLSAVAVILPPLKYSLLPPFIDLVLFTHILITLIHLRQSPLFLSYLFFFPGIILGILENIPRAAVSIPELYADFFSLFMAVSALIIIFGRETVHDSHGDISSLPISEREKEVVRLIIKGEPNGVIAEKLFISPSTVKKHINSIFRKLNIKSRWELFKLTGSFHPKE